jgi:hypothetical protein
LKAIFECKNVEEMLSNFNWFSIYINKTFQNFFKYYLFK